MDSAIFFVEKVLLVVLTKVSELNLWYELSIKQSMFNFVVQPEQCLINIMLRCLAVKDRKFQEENYQILDTPEILEVPASFESRRYQQMRKISIIKIEARRSF